MSRADKKDSVPINWVDKGSGLGRPVLGAKWLVKEGKILATGLTSDVL